MAEMITSLQNPRVKAAIKLHSSRGRKTQNRILIVGQREVKRALTAKLELEEIYCNAQGAEEAARTCAGSGKPPQLVSDEVFEKLTYGNRVEGMVAVACRPDTSMEQFAPNGSVGNRLIVVLEAVEKPGNIGAILRTLDAVSADGLLLANPLADAFHPNSIRASTGVVFGMPIGSGPNEAIQAWLPENGFRVFAARLEDASPFYEARLDGDVALVLGNEALGLSEAWTGPDVQAVKLPMLGIADSLNVSATASVMCYEVLRQRGNRPLDG